MSSWLESTTKSSIVAFTARGTAVSGSTLTEPLSRSSPSLLLVGRQYAGRPGRGKLVNRLWVDSILPKRWKQMCDKLHGCRQFQPPVAIQYLKAGPQWLIDTWRLCLVPASLELPYVALSYTWAKRDPFTTRRGNLCQLQQPNAIVAVLSSDELDTTVRTAIHVVQLLDERYLWVDQLCIVQDDDQTKHREIQNMAAIYANASVTIVAANGTDPGRALPGLRHASEPRNFCQGSYRLPGGENVVESLAHRSVNLPSSWSERGWTFQENLFARRQLVFRNDIMHWQCDHALWYEDEDYEMIHRSHENGPSYFGPRDLFSYHIPDVVGLVDMLRNYTFRELTYEQDILPACAGAFTALRPAFSGGFVSGLPRAFFDCALIWRHSGHATRRKAHHGYSGFGCIPSWSWAGWKGSFDHRNWHEVADFVKSSPRTMWKKQCCPHRIQPLVKWYGHKEPEGPREEVLRGNWSYYQQLYTDSDGHLPPAGWTRIPVEDSDPIFADRSQFTTFAPPLQSKHLPRWMYKHQSHRDWEFWYPVPLFDDETEGYADSMTPYISGYTQRAFVSAGKDFKLQGSSRTAFSILGQEGNWVGALCPDESMLTPQRDSHLRDLADETLEVVAVAQGSFAEGKRTCIQCRLEEHNLEDRPKSQEQYEFFHVMWVEREHGIAYRKGLGRIANSAWESLSREWIDLTLG
ncbi:HET-domain-containing protein [Rhizodiscina lignyota]|uniref:HET-domain-containing protein n=1 Tax=Rhizodiscina lignyota TaxID=1504668 RepID=A0A9P4IPP4_9PEZI|nr:HET-domain-containing protein [Rhizodiscina lignyota]